jgi:hypothetical protein
VNAKHKPSPKPRTPKSPTPTIDYMDAIDKASKPKTKQVEKPEPITVYADWRLIIP